MKKNGGMLKPLSLRVVLSDPRLGLLLHREHFNTQLCEDHGLFSYG
jgi:hypothetical protein